MPTPPTRPKGVQHVAIKVHDIDQAITFYTTVLGMRVSERHEPGALRPGGPGMAFMSFGTHHHDINLVFYPRDSGVAPVPNSREIPGVGLHHYAIRVGTRAEFEAWLRHLDACGVAFVAGPLVHSSIHPDGDRRTPGENRSVYFCDPSGNAIEIFSEMAEMTEDNQISRQWHAERLLRDGYAAEAERVRDGAAPMPGARELSPA